jgi:hypothetical protein
MTKMGYGRHPATIVFPFLFSLILSNQNTHTKKKKKSERNRATESSRSTIFETLTLCLDDRKQEEKLRKRPSNRLLFPLFPSNQTEWKSEKGNRKWRRGKKKNT